MEDDHGVAAGLVRELRRAGFEVELATDGARGAELATTKPFALVVLNELLFQHTVRLPLRCSGSAAAPTTTGNLTRWSDCHGSLQLIRVTGAEHCVLSGAMPCMDNKLVGGDCQASLRA